MTTHPPSASHVCNAARSKGPNPSDADGGLGASPCSPPLDCSREELVAFIRSLKGGERVIEMGQSGMKGETGTVEIRESGVCIRWDTKFDQPGVMVTSFTGGARLLSQANDEMTRPHPKNQ